MDEEEEEPPVNKTMTFLMLPNDLVINCLARVSRLYYPILSLVSKRFRSFLASTELYQTRTFLGRTESCLYVYLQLKTVRWFTLCWKPNSSSRILVPISSLNSPSLIHKSSVVAVGSNIYAINGSPNKDQSNEVMVMDSRSHTWHEAPSMHVSRSFPPTCVLDGKIYVKGRYNNPDATNPMEVFDTKTQTWKFIRIPRNEIWKDVKYLALHNGWGFLSSYCMIENVIYHYSCECNNIEWYDHKERLWKILKGLGSFTWPWLYRNNDLDVNLVDHGGKIVVLSKKCDTLFWNKTIRYGEIAIERCQNGEIWGKIEWFEVVYTPNEPFYTMHVVSVTV